MTITHIIEIFTANGFARMVSPLVVRLLTADLLKLEFAVQRSKSKLVLNGLEYRKRRFDRIKRPT